MKNYINIVTKVMVLFLLLLALPKQVQAAGPDRPGPCGSLNLYRYNHWPLGSGESRSGEATLPYHPEYVFNRVLGSTVRNPALHCTVPVPRNYLVRFYRCETFNGQDQFSTTDQNCEGAGNRREELGYGSLLPVDGVTVPYIRFVSRTGHWGGILLNEFAGWVYSIYKPYLEGTVIHIMKAIISTPP